jgi:hypothetical protein
MAVPAPQNCYITLNALLGLPNTSNVQVCSYNSGTLITASYGLVSNPVIPADTTDFAVDLGELFPGITTFNGIFIREVTATGIGFSVSSNATGTRTAVAAGGIWCVTTNFIAAPTLYFDNSNPDDDCYLQIGVFGS